MYRSRSSQIAFNKTKTDFYGIKYNNENINNNNYK